MESAKAKQEVVWDILSYTLNAQLLTIFLKPCVH